MYGQIEVTTNGYTDTVYEFCGFDYCRELILNLGLGISRDLVFKYDEFEIGQDGNTVTVVVRDHLDESGSCVWCFGCGEFLRHANAGTACECENPEEDREPLRPMVVESGHRLELRRWGSKKA